MTKVVLARHTDQLNGHSCEIYVEEGTMHVKVWRTAMPVTGKHVKVPLDQIQVDEMIEKLDNVTL